MNIIVDLNTPIKDGTEVVFRSPVDCSQVTGLKVYYRGEDGNTASQEFVLADAHGNNVGDIDHLFAENVAVKVILDVSTGMAFVQNADTNSYLENTFVKKEELQELLDVRHFAPGVVSVASGEILRLADSSDMALCGLNIYGKTTQNGTPTAEAPVELENVGADGVIGVQVSGKNIADVVKFSANDSIGISATPSTTNSNGTTISATSGDAITITQAKAGNPSSLVALVNGWFRIGFYCPLRAGDKVTISYNFQITSNPLNQSGMLLMFGGNSTDYNFGSVTTRKDNNTGLYYVTSTVTEKMIKNNTYHFIEIRLGGKSGVFSNFQIEVGREYTGYEPYTAIQTLTAQTPNGLRGIPTASGGNYTDENGQQWICDEIDFARGVYVQNVGRIDSYAGEPVGDVFLSTTGETSDGSTVLYALSEGVEIPLSAEEVAQYAALHTNKPNTIVLNDAGAGMAMQYVVDTKTYIDNKIAELQNAILASGANV